MRRLVIVLALCACKKPADTGTGSATGSAPAGSGSSAPAAAPIDPKAIGETHVGPIDDATKPDAIAALFPGQTPTYDHEDSEAGASDTTTVGGLEIEMFGGAIRKVSVVGPPWATAEGISLASTVQDALAKYPDLACKHEKYLEPSTGDVTGAVLCTTVKYKRLAFYIDAATYDGPEGAVLMDKIASKKLSQISWVPKR